MKKKNKVKWIGSGIFTGICLCLTQAKSMELGGFDVEMGTGEGQDYPSDWWEEPETDEGAGTGAGVETETEQEDWEETPQENQEGDILTGEEGLGEVPVENPSYTEGQPEGMTENRTDTIAEEASIQPPLEESSVTEIPTPTMTPAVTETPTSSALPSPSHTPTPMQTPGFPLTFNQEVSGPFPIFQGFSVFFHHLPVPQNQRKPYVEIQSEGQVGIISVRHNHQECFWWREGNRLFWEMEPAEGENKIEILVITEDCRLVQMEPWVYSGER